MIRIIRLILLFPLFLYAQDEVKIINRDDLKELISERKGKVLILNIWATWCVPCREEIPDLNKLHKTYSQDAEVVGISVDYPDEIKTKIVPFLKEQNIRYRIYVNSIKDEQFINSFPVKWSGAVPATFIYDKNGNLKKFLEGKKKYELFDKAVKDLLRMSPE